ncbi:hypothetical protein WDU94_000085 [Cyamophila willieti]
MYCILITHVTTGLSGLMIERVEILVYKLTLVYIENIEFINFLENGCEFREIRS